MLAKQGHSAPAIARALGCSHRAVQAWVGRYNQGGLAALQERPRAGRPPRLAAADVPRFRDRLEAGPTPEDGVCKLHCQDLRRILEEEFGHGSNAGHSSGVAQGQRSLNRCSGRDFQHEVFAPTATAAFHSQTVAAGMLLQQRPTRRVLSCATAKLLRDEAESMVPNIDPEQVRKLAGWGLTQNDRASFVGWSQSLLSLRF